ncbi:hypothetical protein M885DRAFT_544411 [Pelagophyceae sp. CCMP2097]|nr:hypothetical protein M885DRAFT_544411 [Pelagophyceae sp. CCMP2097]
MTTSRNHVESSFPTKPCASTLMKRLRSELSETAQTCRGERPAGRGDLWRPQRRAVCRTSLGCVRPRGPRVKEGQALKGGVLRLRDNRGVLRPDAGEPGPGQLDVRAEAQRRLALPFRALVAVAHVHGEERRRRLWVRSDEAAKAGVRPEEVRERERRLAARRGDAREARVQYLTAGLGAKAPPEVVERDARKRHVAVAPRLLRGPLPRVPVRSIVQAQAQRGRAARERLEEAVVVMRAVCGIEPRGRRRER